MDELLQKRLAELDAVRQKVMLGGGRDKIDRQHQQGKLAARERIDLLLDPDSFMEINMLAAHAVDMPSDGLVCGSGAIDGRPVFVYSQDRTVRGGDCPMTTLAQNLETIHAQIQAACQGVGRDPSTVKLIAVSKTISLEQIQAAVNLGVADLGENRVEEAAQKMPALPKVTWHMIGHIQSRKAVDVIRLGFGLIHSVDTAKLAARLSRFAQEAGRLQPILLEVNISGEASKSGLVANQWDGYGDSTKAKLLIALQTSQEIESLSIVDSHSKSRVLTLTDFNDIV